MSMQAVAPEARLAVATLRTTGLILLGIGVLLVVQFLWSIPELIRAGKDAAQDGHLTLVVVDGIYDAIRALVVAAAGLLLLDRSRTRRKPQ